MQFSMRFSTPPAVRNLLIINILCYIASMSLPKYGINVLDICGLHYFKSSDFHLHQVVTYMFLHDTSGFSHIFFNMFGLWMFGRAVEDALGTKRFLIFYFITGIGAALVQEVTWMYTVPDMDAMVAINAYALDGDVSNLTPYFQGVSGPAENIEALRELVYSSLVTVGASGALFGILAAFAILYPQAEMFLLFIPIPIKAPIFVALYAACELFLGVSSAGDGVAHYAHLGGLAFGLVLLLLWKITGKLNNSDY